MINEEETLSAPQNFRIAPQAPSNPLYESSGDKETELDNVKEAAKTELDNLKRQ